MHAGDGEKWDTRSLVGLLLVTLYSATAPLIGLRQHVCGEISEKPDVFVAIDDESMRSELATFVNKGI